MGQKYWWAWRVYQGRPVVGGWAFTEQEARRVGIKTLEGDFEVVELPTRDTRQAKAHIRAIMSQRYGLDTALRRFRNNPKGVTRG